MKIPKRWKRRFRLWRQPFKGQFAYELQIMAIVFQWRHDGKSWATKPQFLKIGRLLVWRDTAWLK